MVVLIIFAASGVFYNDVLVLISILGSIVLFLGSFPHSPLRRFVGIAEWNIAPLVFGTLFQIAIAITGVAPEKIGFLMPMTPSLVNALFAVSFMLLVGRWWLRKNQQVME